MLGVVLTNRELSDGFAMLAGPLAHVILVLVIVSCLDIARTGRPFIFGIPLGVALSGKPDSTS